MALKQNLGREAGTDMGSFPLHSMPRVVSQTQVGAREDMDLPVRGTAHPHREGALQAVSKERWL